jgi:hypothetical protein
MIRLPAVLQGRDEGEATLMRSPRKLVTRCLTVGLPVLGLLVILGFLGDVPGALGHFVG